MRVSELYKKFSSNSMGLSSKRSFDDTLSDKASGLSCGDKAYESLRCQLPQEVLVANAVDVTISPALVKMQLEELAKFSLVFGFMGRIPRRGELISWINGPSLLGYAGALEFV